MSWRSERARLAVTVRDHADDPERVAAVRRDLRAARAEDYIRRLVDEAPPLSADQRNRLAVLLLQAGEAS